MEMDLDDDLEAELARRSSQKKVTKEVVSEKSLTREEMEDQSRQAERESEQAKLPDSVDGWERALIASPNNSELWLRYAAHHITLGTFLTLVAWLGSVRRESRRETLFSFEPRSCLQRIDF